MKIFELLNPDETSSPTQPETAPMASMSTDSSGTSTGDTMNATGASAAQPTQQTAGMMDTFKDFMTTPHPIGSASAETTPTVRPATTPQTPATPSSGEQGGVMNSIKNYMTTPHPIGSAQASTPATTPAKPASANPFDGTTFGKIAGAVNNSVNGPSAPPNPNPSMMDRFKNFMTTPHPIGGSNSTTLPKPPTPAAGQPSRPFGQK